MEEEVKKTAAKKTTKSAAAGEKPAEKKTTATSAEKTTKKPAAEKPAAEKKPVAEKKAAAPKAPKETKAEPEVTAPHAHEEEEDFDDDIISLVNDQGETINFYHVATVDYQNEWYVFFQPTEEREDVGEDEVMVFKLDKDEEGNEVFLPIESEELLNNVYAEYVRLVNEHEEEGGGCPSGGCSTCKGCK